MAGDDDDYILVADLEQQTRQVFDDDGDEETSGEGARMERLWAAAVRPPAGRCPSSATTRRCARATPPTTRRSLRDLGKDRADTD